MRQPFARCKPGSSRLTRLTCSQKMLLCQEKLRPARPAVPKNNAILHICDPSNPGLTRPSGLLHDTRFSQEGLEPMEFPIHRSTLKEHHILTRTGNRGSDPRRNEMPQSQAPGLAQGEHRLLQPATASSHALAFALAFAKARLCRSATTNERSSFESFFAFSRSLCRFRCSFFNR